MSPGGTIAKLRLRRAYVEITQLGEFESVSAALKAPALVESIAY